MPTPRFFVLLLSGQLLLGAHASNVGDSLRYLLDTDATLVDRSRALVKMARDAMATDPAAALAHAMNALRFAEQSGDRNAEHDALTLQREVQLHLGMYPEHLRSTMRALEVAQALGDAGHIATDLQALSTAYRVNQRMDKAVDEARNALAIVTGTHDLAAVRYAERFLMHALLRAGRSEEALRNGEKAVAHCDANADSTERARVHLLMARTLLAQGQFNNALPYLTMAARVLERTGTQEDRFMLAIDRAQAAIGMHRLPEAQAQLDIASALLPRTGTHEDRGSLMQQRYRLAEARGEWKEALDLLHIAHGYEDSIRTAGMDLTLAGMQVMYEIGRKDRDNHELRGLNARNEEIIAGQRSSNRWLSIAVSASLVLAVALFLLSRKSLRTARYCRMKNTVIERQKDEIHAKNLELQRQNMRLAETLVSEEQKDIVIKEIHHRVKNNLQVIDSLLNMQCGALQDPATTRMLRDAQGRIRAMSLVHGSIFRSGGERAIPLRDHVQELARNVLAAHGRQDSVSVLVDVADISLCAQDLMPLSLAVNELLTNAIKYAFQGRDHGQIRIILRPSGAGFEMIFSDDGDTRTTGTTHMREGSFGMQLVQALAEQLNGEVRLLKGTGTTLSLTFFPDGMAQQRKAS